MIPEELFQQLWAIMNRYQGGLTTTEGCPVQVIYPGILNEDTGPDFLNARLVIDGQQWAGDVELHVNESDWYTHKHHTDAQYNSVVLHVIINRGKPAVDAEGRPIHTLVVPNAEQLAERYEPFIAQNKIPRCAGAIASATPYEREEWLTRMAVARLEEKSQSALGELESCQGDWEEAIYRTISRSLGLRVNADPMLWLARVTPLKYLLKIRNDSFALEAVLLGQAGLIQEAMEQNRDDGYVRKLWAEYQFQAAKYGLKPLKSTVWKYLRLRPRSFPSLRIAQLAALLSTRDRLLAATLHAKDMAELEKLLKVTPSKYWETRYTLGGTIGEASPKPIGRERMKIMVINAIVPFRFAYARAHANSTMQEEALELLEQLPAERNSVVNRFSQCGLTPKNALHSQAIIHIHNNHCRPRLCYRCPMGLRTITRGATPPTPPQK